MPFHSSPEYPKIVIFQETHTNSIFHSFTRHIRKKEAGRFINMGGISMTQGWSVPEFLVMRRRNREVGTKLKTPKCIR